MPNTVLALHAAPEGGRRGDNSFASAKSKTRAPLRKLRGFPDYDLLIIVNDEELNRLHAIIATAMERVRPVTDQSLREHTGRGVRTRLRE